MPRDRRDITVSADDLHFKFRVAALITHAGQLLLAGTRYEGHRYPPGGKVHLGEDSRAALARELHEELGLHLEIGDLRYILENLHGHPDGRARHELALWYEVAWPNRLPPEEATAHPQPGHHLIWAPLDNLQAARFQPRQLAAGLSEPHAANSPQHMIIGYRPAPQPPEP